MASPIAQLRGVGKSFGATVALADVDLDLPEGRVMALIGESGSGKSTLLRLLVGLVRADGGDISLFGDTVSAATDFTPLRRRTGYVIQDGGLFPHLTAAENAALAAEAIGEAGGWTRERRRQRLEELAELTHLEADWLDRYPGELSGGQRQRVALMRGLFLDPDLLLLDEPLGALDPVIRRNLQDDLHALFATLGKTVVLVTHDLPEAAFFSDDLVLMHQARIVQRGTLNDLRERPATDYVSEFVAATRGLPETRS